MDSQPRHLETRHGVVGIHMHDGHFEPFGQVAGVKRATGVAGQGGKADLIVGNDVDGSASRVAIQIGKVKRFGHGSLAGEGGITVDLDGERLLRLKAGRTTLGGGRPSRPRHARHERVNQLQMAGVGRNFDVEHDPIAAGPNPIRPFVIFHVARLPQIPFIGGVANIADGVFELAQNIAVKFVQDVRHHVETAAMSHPNQDGFDRESGGLQNHLVQNRDEHVYPFDGKPLFPDKRFVQKLLKHLHFDEPLEQPNGVVAVGVERLAEAAGFGRFAQPCPLLRVAQVVVVVADAAAVHLAQAGDGFVGVGGRVCQWPAHGAGGQVAQVRFGQPVRLQFERWLGGHGVERVAICV